ncbi:MAG: hypothetical protein KDD44_11990 [Bdellovibrionales bacterium]|nr:hypothetical protein [Bdellovibrionales bacterium]
MIDRRLGKFTRGTAELSLQLISDNEVVLNFQRALSKLYPSLISINSHAAETYHHMTRELFDQMVYQVFSRKYGIARHEEEFHRYATGLHCYRKIHHIECVPKKLPLTAFRESHRIELNHEELQDKLLVFREFRDNIYDLSKPIERDHAGRVHFNMAEIEIASATSGYRFRSYAASRCFIWKDDVEFVFVAESFDADEHAKFREVFA